MRFTVLLVMFAIASFSAAHATREHESSKPRHSGSSVSGNRSYATPGTYFRNDLRGAYSNTSPWAWQRPWYSDAACYGWDRHRGRGRNWQPGLSIIVQHGDWRASWSSQPAYGSYGLYCQDFGNCSYAGYPARHNYCGNPAIQRDENWQVSRPLYDYQYYTTGMDNTRDWLTNRDQFANAYPVYNDNRQYHYYGANAKVETPPETVGSASSSRPVEQQPATGSRDAWTPTNGVTYSAIGRRFNDQTRLCTPDGNYLFVIRSSAVYAGLESEKPTKLTDKVDEAFAAFAAWTPGAGVCLVYRENDKLWTAASSSAGWWKEALPYEVDFSQKPSLGLVGGQPWLVFSSAEGTRYVLAYGSAGWTEVGSGSAR